MPILPTDPNTGQSQGIGQALGDLFSGTNRPALNAFVANSQARNGLVSAQTQEAMIKASQAQEQMTAWDHIKSDFIAQGHPDSEATLMRDGIVAATNHDAVNAQNIIKAGNTATLSNPALLGSPAQTAAMQGNEGKLAPLENVPNNFAVAPGAPQPVIQQSPQGQAQTANSVASAKLRELQTTHPELFHPSAGAQGSLDDNAAYNAAVKYNQWGTMPSLGLGAAAAQDRRKVLSWAAQLSVNPNWTPPEWSSGSPPAGPAAHAPPPGAPPPGAPPPGAPPPGAPPPGAPPVTPGAPPVVPAVHPNMQTATDTSATPADTKAQTAMLADQTKRAANADSAEQTALKNFEVARKVLATADQTGSPYANSMVNLIRNRVFGDKNVAAYQNAVSTARTEYARVISMATGASGITDYAMKEGQKLFPDDLAPEQFEGNVAVATQEMANRTGSMHDQIAQAKRTLHTPPGATPAPAGAPPGAAAPMSLDAYLKSQGL